MSELTHCNFFLVKCIVKPSFIMIFLFDHRMTIDASEFKKKKEETTYHQKHPAHLLHTFLFNTLLQKPQTFL